MTTEELKNAAGFKAVDAEGNELGVVSLSDIVSAVKQELQPSGVARASVAALSEVSTQAATDTYEDQLPQKTDVTWIRGLDESGNPILISKQSLVSVLEELIGNRYTNRIVYSVTGKNDEFGYVLIKNPNKYPNRFIRITARCTADIANAYVAYAVLNSQSTEILSESESSIINALPLDNYSLYLKLNINSNTARYFLIIIEVLSGVSSNLSIEYQTTEPV